VCSKYKLKKKKEILVQWKSVVNGKECGIYAEFVSQNTITSESFIMLWGIKSPDTRHHLQGLHVVLVTIIPLPQTPQPFQFLSAQNLKYITLFSFCKKFFCMKNLQQI